MKILKKNFVSINKCYFYTMQKYSKQTRLLLAIDCIIIGYDGNELKLLLIRRGFEPEKDKWSLMGGFVQKDESLDEAANHILKNLTGIDKVYMEQLFAFGSPQRDPVERTVSVAYFSLLDLTKYRVQLNDDYMAEWFSLKNHPKLIFDHNEMVEMGKRHLRYKASLHPILFELLPEKFTLQALQSLFEELYEVQLDKRNFTRKILSTKLLKRLKEKEKQSSKKGAFYYQLDKKHYKQNFHAILRLIPNLQNI
jgi:8-oxo-dGTP diphosphatase